MYSLDTWQYYNVMGIFNLSKQNIMTSYLLKSQDFNSAL